MCFRLLCATDRTLDSSEPNIRIPARLFEICDCSSGVAVEHDFLDKFHGGFTARGQEGTRNLPDRYFLFILGLVFSPRLIL